MILLNIMFKIENHGVYLLVVKVRHTPKKSSSSSHHQSSFSFLGTNLDTNANLYGTHPFYLVMEQIQNTNHAPSGHMHGILLLNSNAMDYTFDTAPSLTIRTIGGVLDFFVFLGPAPEHVIQQYTWLIGRTMMPPYWSLGFQLSRWDYANITHMKNIVQRNRETGIPLDVQYADIDYMDAAKDFTIDAKNFQGLKEYFRQLNDDGIRTVIILDPGTIDDQTFYTPTIDGIENDVFIKWDDGTTLMKGSCWPGDVFFPGTSILIFLHLEENGNLCIRRFLH